MKTAFKNMYVLSGHEDMKPESGKVVLVEDGKIKDIVDASFDLTGYEVVDLNGAYMLPGLINLHVHIPGSGKPKKGRTNYNAIAKLFKSRLVQNVFVGVCQNYAMQQLLSGTTTIRAVGGMLDLDTRVRDRINAGKGAGPRIYAANYAISVPGGHMTGSVALPVNSKEEAAKMVEDLAKTKPDLIKLMITGGCLDAEVPGEPGVLKMPAEYVKAACDKAHELGFQVAAHVEGNEGMVVALENGVDTIEHGGAPSEKTTELFKKTGSALVGTLSPAVPFAEMDPSITGMGEIDLINGKALLKNMIENIKVCLKEGIAVGLGTDTGCPYITHYDMWRELYYYQKYIGVSSTFAIHTATEVNAKILHKENEFGTIDIGKSADFMIVEKNPIEDLKALRQAKMVVCRGQIFNNPQPKKMEQVEIELDKCM